MGKDGKKTGKAASVTFSVNELPRVKAPTFSAFYSNFTISYGTPEKDISLAFCQADVSDPKEPRMVVNGVVTMTPEHARKIRRLLKDRLEEAGEHIE